MRMAGDPSRAFSSAELAADLGLSRNHLAKIIQHLARAGLIDTRRGGGGGAVLARPAAEIRLGRSSRLLEEGQPLVECFGAEGGTCSIDGAMPPEGPPAVGRGGVPGRSGPLDPGRYRPDATAKSAGNLVVPAMTPDRTRWFGLCRSRHPAGRGLQDDRRQDTAGHARRYPDLDLRGWRGRRRRALAPDLSPCRPGLPVHPG